MEHAEILNRFLAGKQTIPPPAARSDPRREIRYGSDHLDEGSGTLGQMQNALEDEDAEIRSPGVGKQRCENQYPHQAAIIVRKQREQDRKCGPVLTGHCQRADFRADTRRVSVIPGVTKRRTADGKLARTIAQSVTLEAPSALNCSVPDREIHENG